LDNPTAASKWLDDIFEKVLILKSSPRIGRTLPELNRK
jgi:plasmid stabilization system protein ParE